MRLFPEDRRAVPRAASRAFYRVLCVRVVLPAPRKQDASPYIRLILTRRTVPWDSRAQVITTAEPSLTACRLPHRAYGTYLGHDAGVDAVKNARHAKEERGLQRSDVVHQL